MTKFKIVRNSWDDYVVEIWEDGVLNEERCYYTNDPQDAITTWKHMIETCEKYGYQKIRRQK